MIKSMTGFGRFELTEGTRHYTVEIKSVNHRYLDLSVKLPKKLNFFEVAIRNLLKKYMLRGKVDVYLTYEEEQAGLPGVCYHPEVARAYYENLCRMSEDLGLENDISLVVLSHYPEVFTLEERTEDETEVWDGLEQALKGAAERFVAARLAEGEHLKQDLLAKLSRMSVCVDYVEKRSPQIVTEYRERLTAKVTELLGETQLDPGILATELILYADKICVDEETVRLKSHIHNMEQVLEETEGIGRKLDFIAQEMNREANTILSKSNDLALSDKAIELKTEIEKLREQIQNIE